MTARTIAWYLLGRRQAILDVAGSRHAVWLGLLLVFSAALAREYDGEDLLHNPAHLLLPLAASLATSFMLFSLVWVIARRRGIREGSFAAVYPRFLALYWMTAPLAWLYAIPVERFMSAEDATRANLLLLGLVSLWRVALMTRVVSVVFSSGHLAALCIVMLFADAVALVLLYLTPLPVIVVMGGIRLTESERLIQTVAFVIGAAGVLSMPVWLAGALIAAFHREATWRLAPGMAAPCGLQVGRSAWSLAALSLLIWIPILPFTQSEQRLRRVVEQDLRAGRIEQALATMAAHERSDFPPLWDPPPRIGYGERSPPLIAVMETLADADVPSWVREVYVDKYRRYFGIPPHHSGYTFMFLDDASFRRHVLLWERLPEGALIIEDHRQPLTWELDSEYRGEAVKERLRALLQRHAPAD